MMLKSIVQDVTPPIIWGGIQSLKRFLSIRSVSQVEFDTITFEGEFATWEEASKRCVGYDDSAILVKVLEATLKVKHGLAAYERDSVLFDEIHYSWPVLAGLLLTVTRNDGSLNVLDFGGSLGSSFFQNREFLQTLPDVRWNVVEQEHYVNAGRASIQDDCLRFYHNIDECLCENRPNAILLSSVLQYLADPEGLLDRIVKAKADVIILDRTIVNYSDEHRIYIQHVPPSIYSASYPCRSLSESLLIKAMTPYHKTVEFESLPFPALRTIESEFKGYIFDRTVA